MQIYQATITDLDLLTPLFNDYRVFYRQTPNLEKTRRFLQQRLDNQDSTIFIAMDGSDKSMGFTQLYPCFSSIEMERIYILNDLYVKPEYRKQNIARKLMRQAKDFAVANHASELLLSTEITNTIAQKLYESEGYQKNERFIEYSLNCKC